MTYKIRSEKLKLFPSARTTGHWPLTTDNFPTSPHRECLFHRSIPAARLQRPLAWGELPEKAAVGFRWNRCATDRPMDIAADRRLQFDHLLFGRKNRIHLIGRPWSRIEDSRLRQDRRSDGVLTTRTPTGILDR